MDIFIYVATTTVLWLFDPDALELLKRLILARHEREPTLRLRSERVKFFFRGDA